MSQSTEATPVAATSGWSLAIGKLKSLKWWTILPLLVVGLIGILKAWRRLRALLAPDPPRTPSSCERMTRYQASEALDSSYELSDQQRAERDRKLQQAFKDIEAKYGKRK